MCAFVVQNGGGPEGGSPDNSPDKSDNTRSAQEMDTLSTPVLAGAVNRSQTDLDLRSTAL